MEIIKLDLKRAVKAIREGKVLVCPTDTVYGLICDFNNKKAVERLYKIKKRPKWKLLPVFIKDIKMAKKLAYINKKQEEFLNKVWPGAVTVILKSRKQGTIGLRIPSHKFVLGLAKHRGPLAESSANISGQPASVKIKDVLKQFKYPAPLGRGSLNKIERQPDLVINAGNLPKAKPSKVIDLTIWPPKILRQ
ncbi:MAG: L-threonylcarbamoyladenylate synthase [bacterium]|nr:L-threonylcarbamoyladenylate synthase [bacterium]